MSVLNPIYKSFYSKWDNKSSIRSNHKCILPLNENKTNYFFPRSKQPLCEHPKIKALGEKTIAYILLQTAYKVLNEVAVVEIDGISDIATKIYNGKLDYGLSDIIRSDILLVLIDEAYHAQVANNLINQFIVETNILPIQKSRATQFGNTLEKFKKKLPSKHHNSLEIIAVCIGENTLTHELIDMSKDKNVHPSFKQVMMDHLADEGRHQILFREILRDFWSNISEKEREILGLSIPEFIIEYFCPDMSIQFDKLLLGKVGLSIQHIDEVITDIYYKKSVNQSDIKDSSITKNLLNLMDYAKILDNELLRKKFVEVGIL